LSGSPTSKKLSSCVRPGVFEVRASALRFASALSSDDLPTFERPANATSGTTGFGRCSSLGADLRNAIGPAKIFPRGLDLVLGEGSVGHLAFTSFLTGTLSAGCWR
jgi:hypothetical protein